MKTKFFLVIISVFLLACNSRKPQVIKYDFSKGTFDTENIKPEHGRPTVLEIKNINNLFYKVEITPQDVAIKDKTLFDETPEPPKGNETPEIGEAKVFTASSKIEKEMDKSQNSTKLNRTVDMTLKINAIENEIAKNNNIINEKKREKQDRENRIGALESQLRQSKSSEELYNALSLVKAGEEETKEIIKERIAERTKLQNTLNDTKEGLNAINLSIIEYESLNKELNDKVTDFKSKDRTVKDLIINYLSDVKTKYRQLYLSAENIVRINECYNNYIDKVYTSELTYNEYMKIRNKEGLENPVIINLEKLNNFYAEITQFDKEKADLLLKLNDIDLYRIKEKLAELPNGETLITDLNADLNAISKDITDLSKVVGDLNIRKKLNYVESLDRILGTENSYTYTSIPIQGFEDYLQFDVTLISKTKKKGENKYIIDRDRTFKYKEYLKGGVRFDFSIGTVFDIGNKQQEYDVVQDNNGYKIIQTTNNEYIPTIAGMLHSSWRSSNNFAFGVTLGVSMDMTKLSLNSLFPGVSLLIGKTDKIVLTAGPALRKVTQLTSGFTLNTSFNSSPEGYTSESYKLGWFVGISWNLTNKQKSLMRLSY